MVVPHGLNTPVVPTVEASVTSDGFKAVALDNGLPPGCKKIECFIATCLPTWKKYLDSSNKKYFDVLPVT